MQLKTATLAAAVGVGLSLVIMFNNIIMLNNWLPSEGFRGHSEPTWRNCYSWLVACVCLHGPLLLFLCVLYTKQRGSNKSA
jgi:hypothetical protein